MLHSLSLVAVGSTNPVKVAAVRAVLERVAPRAQVEPIGVASEVPAQPWGDDETIRGARTRARAAMAALGAELGVGIEGGVVEDADGAVRTCAWAAVVTRDGRSGIGGSLAMPLPPAVAALLREGRELGDAMDRLTGLHDVKRGQGAVGVLTAGLVDRRGAYEVLLAYALAPFLAEEYWGDVAERGPSKGRATKRKTVLPPGCLIRSPLSRPSRVISTSTSDALPTTTVR
jgi:inosine/xanthosine triphosphatase